jgi:hypothetical protein
MVPNINLLKPTIYVMHQQVQHFNAERLLKTSRNEPFKKYNPQ